MITPNTVNFNYKKFGQLPTPVLLYHNYTFTSVPTAPLPSEPSLTFYDPTTNNVKIGLNAGPADNLPVGLNTFVVDVILYDTDKDENINLGTITVNITVEDTIVLDVSPNNISFNYEIGAATPNPKTISVVSENPWTVSKTQSWLSLSSTNGSNSGTFEVSVITTGLGPNSYSDVITITDGKDTRTINVNFVVTEANSGNDFAYITPQLLKFGFTKGGTTPPAKTIELNVSDNWTATKNQTWLNLPTTSGASGVQIIDVAILNNAALNTLEAGTHFATVTITVGNIIRSVEIQLEVYDFTTQAPSNEDLLFTDDENLLALESGRLDTFMSLRLTTSYKAIFYNYMLRLPVFRGGAKRNLGLVPKKIIGDQDLKGLGEINVFQPYEPLLLNITYSEKENFTESVIAESSLNNLKFIKGSKPTSNFISEIARTVFLTKKATLCFSVLSNNATTGTIEITGDISKTINVADSIEATKDFYTVVLPVSEIGDLEEGSEVNVTFLGETVKVIYVNEAVDHTMVYWLNEWGTFDSLELTGEVFIRPGVKRSSADFRVGENKLRTKILRVLKPTDYVVNSGIIHTNETLEMIYKMLNAKVVYLQTQNALVPVIPETTRVPTYRTLRILKTFDISFKHAEQ